MALVSLRVISIFKCKHNYRSRALRDNGNNDGQRITMNYHSPWVSFVFVVLFMHIPCSKLTNCLISTKHAKRYGCCAASQTTPVQIKHVLCCFVLQNLRVCAILIPVRVLLIIWYVLIN